MENKEQVYSADGERYTDYCSMMDDLREFYDEGEEAEVWEADKKEWKHSDFICRESVIETMQENAMDDCGEIAEEYLNELTVDQKIDLEKHIAKWFNENTLPVTFYGVENEHKIVVIVE